MSTSKDVADAGECVIAGFEDALHQTESGWIPVNERLPAKYHTVLAFDNVLHMTLTVFLADDPAFPPSSGHSVWFIQFSHGVYLEHVTHWMPLPAPPAE